MRRNWFVIAMLALAALLGGCTAQNEAGLDEDETADEARIASWEKVMGAWTRDQGMLTGIVFTSTADGRTSHRYFADREVWCITTPCYPVREEGSYRVTTRYVYLTQGGVTERFNYTLANDVLELRQDRQVVYRFRRAVSYCAKPADCHEQHLVTPRCWGGFACEANACAYRCGLIESQCETNADCGDGAYCRREACTGPGVCQQNNTVRCSADYVPVCGCDGQTYTNACQAMVAGVNVAAEGACRLPPVRACQDNSQCNEGEYCRSENGCATEGVCTAKPTDVFCTAVVTPYCGCDGVTRYSGWGCVYDRYAHRGECP